MLSSQGCSQLWVGHVDFPFQLHILALSQVTLSRSNQQCLSWSYLCTISKYLTYTEPHLPIRTPAQLSRLASPAALRLVPSLSRPSLSSRL
jgi:hypothetical protein